MSMMRAKLEVSQVERYKAAEILHFRAVAAARYEADGSDENNTFAKYTPSADLKMQITNPELIGKFNPGDVFYADFTPASNQK